MIKQIAGISVLAASLMAAGNMPVHADAAADGLAKAKEKLATYTAKPVFRAPGERSTPRPAPTARNNCRSRTRAPIRS
jgi:hypothetical protein